MPTDHPIEPEGGSRFRIPVVIDERVPEGLVGVVHDGGVVAGFKLEPWQARFVEAFQKGETPRLASPDEVEVARRRHDKEMLRAVLMVGER